MYKLHSDVCLLHSTQGFALLVELMWGEEQEVGALSDAKWLLGFYGMYQQYAQQGIAEEALANLAKLEGPFGANSSLGQQPEWAPLPTSSRPSCSKPYKSFRTVASFYR